MRLSGRGSGLRKQMILFICQPAHRGIKRGGDLLGGVSALQETDQTGPVSIFKLLPSVITVLFRPIVHVTCNGVE